MTPGESMKKVIFLRFTGENNNVHWGIPNGLQDYGYKTKTH